jgi:hypothetical protein
MIPEEVWRRIRKLEDAVENGRFIRRDIFDLVVHEMREDNARTQSELGQMRAELKEERETRETDRKGLRNLMLGALFAAVGSLVVSFVLAQTL